MTIASMADVTRAIHFAIEARVRVPVASPTGATLDCQKLYGLTRLDSGRTDGPEHQAIALCDAMRPLRHCTPADLRVLSAYYAGYLITEWVEELVDGHGGKRVPIDIQVARPLTYEQVAAEFGYVSANAVKQRIKRAKAKVRRALNEMRGDPC